MQEQKYNRNIVETVKASKGQQKLCISRSTVYHYLVIIEQYSSGSRFCRKKQDFLVYRKYNQTYAIPTCKVCVFMFIKRKVRGNPCSHRILWGFIRWGIFPSCKRQYLLILKCLISQAMSGHFSNFPNILYSYNFYKSSAAIQHTHNICSNFPKYWCAPTYIKATNFISFS